MKTRAFNAVCPLEIGDMVAVTMEENGKKTAYYMPQGIVIEINRAAKVQKVTDIAAVHYCRSGRVCFLYELDNSGRYESLMVKVPVKQMSDELERRGR